jgi:hypothetical protein
MRWLFLIAFAWAVGALSLWWMFRPPKARREIDREAKRERNRQIERERLAEWERLDAARRDAKRRQKKLNDRFRPDDPKP